MPERTCSVSGCDSPAYVRGWCRPHYSRWLRTGDPIDRRPSLVERFWAKVDKTPLCWEWTAHLSRDGYGKFSADGRKIEGAHRVAYELLVGPIPEGMQLDHVCRNRSCVRPSHLEVVTNAENQRRGIAGEVLRRRLLAIDECKHGHPYTPENTYVDPRTGARNCRECGRARCRARRRRLQA